MRALVGATLPSDSESVGVRLSYRIPAATPAQVALVTSEKTCKSALVAYKIASPGESPAPTSVYVVAVGSVYVVWTAYRPANSEWSTDVVFNSGFQVLAIFGG
jgi:hypothetical protein